MTPEIIMWALLTFIGTLVTIAALELYKDSKLYKYTNPFSRTCKKCGARYDKFDPGGWELIKPGPYPRKGCLCTKRTKWLP